MLKELQKRFQSKREASRESELIDGLAQVYFRQWLIEEQFDYSMLMFTLRQEEIRTGLSADAIFGKIAYLLNPTQEL